MTLTTSIITLIDVISVIIRLKDPSICCLQKTLLRFKDTNRLKVKGWKKIHHIDSSHKRGIVLYWYQTKK